MALLSFKDRIEDIAGSLGSADDNALQQWLLDGCYDVIEKAEIAQMSNKHVFSIQSSAYTSSMSVPLDSIRQVIAVQRDGYDCRMVGSELRNFVDPNHTLGADSIHKAASTDPVCYIYDNTLVVKPNPTASQQGHYSYIPEYEISDFNSSSSSIDNFPKEYYEHVIIYACIKTLDRQLLDLISNTNIDTILTSITTQMADVITKFNNMVSRTTGTLSSNEIAGAADALLKAESLVDDAASSVVNNNIQDLLNDEDTEMVQSTISAVNAELQRAQSEMAQWKSIGDMGSHEVNADIGIVQAYISELQGRLERDMRQYQWYQEKRNNLQQDYLSKFPGLMMNKKQGGQ